MKLNVMYCFIFWWDFFFLTKDHGIFDRYPCFSDLKINPYNIVEYCGLAYLDVWMSNFNCCFPGTLKNSFFTMLKYFQLLLVCFVTYYFWSYEWKPDVWLIKSKLNRGTHLLVGMCTYSAQISFECFVALKRNNLSRKLPQTSWRET